MAEDLRRVSTLQGDGHLVFGDHQVEVRYYLEVFAEEDTGASSSRRYSGMVAEPGEALLEVGSEYTLVLEDGRLKHSVADLSVGQLGQQFGQLASLLGFFFGPAQTQGRADGVVVLPH